MGHTEPTSPAAGRTSLLIPAALAGLKILAHLPVLARYGFHHDELYFIACGAHPAFGYVDHPPLVPWIARLSTSLFGDSLVGLRLFPLLAGAAAMFMLAVLVWRLGGGVFAQLTAGLAFLIAPVYLRSQNMLCIPAFEPLFWTLGAYFLVRIIQEDNPRLWLWVGVVTGVGLLNKHAMLFFGFGLVVALALTPLRRHFKSPWLYLGGAVAGLIFLPNLVWQATNDWATVGFLMNLNEGVMSGISVLQFLAGQILYLNPVNAILWIWGLVFFFTRPGKEYRALGWMWLAIFVLLVVTRSKIYYLAPAYPMLLAGGAVALARWVERRRAWLRPVTAGVLILAGVAMAPLSLPILHIDTTEQYIHRMTFGAFENVYELTRDLRGMFGWHERVAAVAAVYHRLPPAEQATAVIFAPHYGGAGAVDLFGPEYGLPPATSLSMSYWLWGLPEQGSLTPVIGVGWDKETMEKLFDEVEVARVIRLEHAAPGGADFPVTICRQPKYDLRALWLKNRPW